MGSQWLLLLLLLLIGDGALNLPALSNNGRDNAPEAALSLPTTRRKSTSESQEHTTSATPPTLPLTSTSTGSTEQTTPKHRTQEENLNTTIITTFKGTTLSNTIMASTWKDQGGTSRTIDLSSVATSAETPKQNQITLITDPSASNTIVNGMESSVSTDSEKSATITAPTALNAPGDDLISLGSMTAIVSEKSAIITSLTTSNKMTDVKESLPMTTGAVTHITSLTTTSLGTTVLGTTMPGSQEGEITAASPTPTTAPTMSKLSTTHHNTAPQAPSHPAESASSVGTATCQSPETTAAHSKAFNPSFPGTTKSSAMTGDSQASPKHTQSSDPGAGACALDEYPVIQGVCMCNESYYTHSELSRVLVTLHCWPQNIEVVLNSYFLETRHWVLMEGTFSGCSSISKIEQGRRVHVFMMEKKEGTCGLHLSTNNTHALYSLEVQLLQVSPNFTNIDSTMLSFSCTYPLVVNVSHTQPYPVVSFPHRTIHIPGAGDIIVILGIFTDPQLSTPLEDRTAPLGIPLYVVLRATSSDPDRFALVATEVFASTNISKTGSVKATHHFVNNSCPVSNRLLQGLRANRVSLEVTLAFTLFRFLTSDTLYLHGRVTLCDKRAGRPCQPVSGQPSGVLSSRGSLARQAAPG
ncbi:centrosomal protein of 85 kDa isoform X3 [Cynocephalus volans]|uniref:centrosomal protein of 85 kDa isoform X3 n=1 Tax=Cynocephalus volans TaxID=110931 RepID=UPI002FCCB248